MQIIFIVICLHFFVCVIFTYYSCEYIVQYIHCVAHAYLQTYSQSFYNFHLFIIISQRRQKHFQFANDKWHWMLYWKYHIFHLPMYVYDYYYYDAHMYIHPAMLLLSSFAVHMEQWNRVNCWEWKAFSEHTHSFDDK